MAGDRVFRLAESNVSTGKDKIDEAFFGGNFLFDRDKTGADGTFDDKAAVLNIDFIRYPGGTLAEEHFLLNDPDRTSDAAGGKDMLTPLSDFIAYAQEAKAEFALVVPTVRYMEALVAGEMSMAEIRKEIRDFAAKLGAGEFGDALPKIIEIGNEYYAHPQFNDVEGATAYAQVAKAFAGEIRDALGDKVEIAVQAGIDSADNAAILNHFGAADGLVDKVIYHTYPWTIDKLDEYDVRKSSLADAWLDAGVAEGVFASEFNMSNQHMWDGRRLGADDLETGLAKAIGLVELVGDLAASGVDYAAVWPLQQNTNGDLAGNEGETSATEGKLNADDLTLSGAAFKLLSDTLVGKSFVKSATIDLDNAKERARFENEAYVQAFEDAREVVLFVSAYDLQSDQIGARIGLDIDGRFSEMEITRLTADGDPLNPNARAIQETSERDIGPNGDISVTLESEYEVIRVVLKKIDESLSGGQGDDMFNGREHHDVLQGFAGDDTLIGGAGEDTLKGALDNDKIRGGSGDDVARGGSGDDTLAGGSGDDLLIGGSGDDLVRGGSGDDNIRGGRGEDRLRGGKDDDVMAGGRSDDQISGGSGDDTLRGGRDDDTLSGGSGADELNGGSGRDVLSGGAGADILFAGSGGDKLTGGSGADSFVFTSSSGGPRTVIRDFKLGQDKFVVRNSKLDADDFSIGRAGDGDAIVFIGGARVLLDGVSASKFDLGDISHASLTAKGVQPSQAPKPAGATVSADNAAVDGIDARLEIGVASDAALGHKYLGLKAENAEASVAFDANGEDLTLAFRSFDIDVNEEVEVFLNDASLGHLDVVGNNVFGFHELDFDAEDLVAGENVVTFVETHPQDTTWGIDQLIIA